MNDLTYRDWMIFQKSFFHFTSFSAFAQETIQFFTKKEWANGLASRSLIIGELFHPYSEKKLECRLIEPIATPQSISHLIETLKTKVSLHEYYDYVLLDFREFFENQSDLTVFLNNYALELAQILRKLVVEDRYCAILVKLPDFKKYISPVPWVIAFAFRDHLRLRDEKIGLIENSDAKNSIVYCLFFQSTADERCSNFLFPKDYVFASKSPKIPLWLIVRSPPRKKDEKFHPAKFPEPLIEEFIRLFTKEGDIIFDPMVGTGSALIAAAKMNRAAFGLELIPTFVSIAKKRIKAANPQPLDQWLAIPDSQKISKPEIRVLNGDAREISSDKRLQGLEFHYCITSPPYWSMLTSKGSEYQRHRRKEKMLQTYSNDSRDLGNITDYNEFLDVLVDIYKQIAEKLVDGGYLTIIVKNVKRNHVIYPLAWDLFRCLCRKNGKFQYVGTTLWCLDDTKIRPFALGTHWVSNTLHQYCLHFKKQNSRN